MGEQVRFDDDVVAELRAMRMEHVALAAEVKAEIRAIKETLLKMEKIEASIDKIQLARARESGQVDGAVWALAKVGAVAVAFFGFIGWLVSGGWLDWLKHH